MSIVVENLQSKASLIYIHKNLKVILYDNDNDDNERNSFIDVAKNLSMIT